MGKYALHTSQVTQVTHAHVHPYTNAYAIGNPEPKIKKRPPPFSRHITVRSPPVCMSGISMRVSLVDVVGGRGRRRVYTC